MRLALLLALALAAPAAAQTPLPPPHPLRPQVEPIPEPLPRPTPGTGDSPRPEQPPARPDRPPPEPPADLSDAEHEACLAGLRAAGVQFEPHPPIADEACRAARPLRVTRLGQEVTLSAPIVTLCRTATALNLWVREDVQPAAARELGGPVVGLQVGGSYECRNRNRAANGAISEHAFANAVDVVGFTVRGHPPVRVAVPAPEPTAGDRFLTAVRTAACTRFTTVIGPGTDAAHADHLHLDLRERRRGFRLCQ